MQLSATVDMDPLISLESLELTARHGASRDSDWSDRVVADTSHVLGDVFPDAGRVGVGLMPTCDSNIPKELVP